MKEIWLAVIPATIPTLAVLVGILLNQNSANRLDAKIDRLEARISDRIDHLEARVDTLSKQLNDAIIMLMGRDTDKSERLARL